MAIVDVLDEFPVQHPKRKEILALFQSFAESILIQRDSKSKLWYQVINRQDSQGNYLEASASAMFIYAFAKGVSKSYLPQKFGVAARESFQGLIDHLVTIGKSGEIVLNDVCKVSGLGGNPYRDGSYEYYIGEPRRANDFKGYGPFLLSAIEIEKLRK
jgi:unsaturated rhamnogalacturonyl hydrolase